MFCWTLHLNEGLDRLRPGAVAVENEVYCFGGARDGNWDRISVDVFNTVSLRWRKLSPVLTGGDERHLDVPTERDGHTAVLIGDTIYIWGGNIYNTRGQIDYSTRCNVFYAFDVDTHRWFKPKVSGTVPDKRSGHSAAVLGEVMFILGGHPQLTYDLYKLDTTTMVWSFIDPGGNGGYTSSKNVATIIGTKMFVFSHYEVGLSFSLHSPFKQYNNMGVYDTETNLWLVPLPTISWPYGVGHSPFTYNGELYIFKSETQYMASDLWKFNPKTFSWKKVELKGKGPSSMNMMCCCCMAGDRLILVFNDDDLFVFDLSPSLKTLCKLAVIQCGLDHSELPHNIRWELAAMRTNGSRKGNSLAETEYQT